MVTLRMTDGYGELSFRSDAGEESCKRIGQQSLAVLLRPTVFPVRFADDSAAELHIVDAGVKLFVRQELVRYCAFTEMRSWWNDAKKSTLSIVTQDYRTLVLGCDECAQAADAMAEKSLAVARAVHHSTQLCPPRSLSALPEGVPVLAEHAPHTENPEQKPVLKRDVHVTIQAQAEEEQADGAKSRSGSDLDVAQVEVRKIETQQSVPTEEAAAATIAASYEEQLARMQATIAAAHAEAATALEETARQRAAADHTIATETQELEATRAAVAAAAQKEADAMQSAMRQTIEEATLQAHAEAKAASQVQVETLEARYQQLLRDQGSAATSAQQQADENTEAKVRAIETKYEALLAEQAAEARRDAPVAETEAQVQAVVAKYEALLAEQTAATAAAEQAAEAAAAAAAATASIRAETPAAVSTGSGLQETTQIVRADSDTGHSDNDAQPVTAPASATWPVAPKQLRSAVRKGVLAVVRQHVVSGQWANSLMSRPEKSDDGSPKVGPGLLYAAAQRGHAAIVQHLLRHSADPNAANSNGSTPLYTAVFNNHEAVAKDLLGAGANPLLAKKDGWTPLALAKSRRGSQFQDSILALLEDAATRLESSRDSHNVSSSSSDAETADDEEVPSFSPAIATAQGTNDSSGKRSPASAGSHVGTWSLPLSTELEALAQLRREGLLTEVEFSHAKAATINSSLSLVGVSSPGGLSMSSDTSLYYHEHGHELTPAKLSASGDRTIGATSEVNESERDRISVKRGSTHADPPQVEQQPEPKPEPAPEPEPELQQPEQPELQQPEQPELKQPKEPKQDQPVQVDETFAAVTETEADPLQLAIMQHRVVLNEAQRSGGALFKAGRMADALLQFGTALEAIRELMIVAESVGHRIGDDPLVQEMADTDCGWQQSEHPDDQVSTLRSTLLGVLEVRAIAYYNLGDYHSSLRDASHCITLDGTRLVGYMRAARALQKLGRLEEAKQCMLAATQAEQPSEPLD